MRQTERLAAAGLQAYVGIELEFIVFRDTYEQAWSSGYRALTPANLYNVDYSFWAPYGSSRCCGASRPLWWAPA